MAQPDWSHVTTLEATLISPSEARTFVSRHLVEYRLLHLVEPVRLVVSELATNALVHGQTTFDVTLSREDDTVRLMVRDGSDWAASDRSDEVLGAGGRGLVIVDVLSREWGVTTAMNTKTVWATFDTQRLRSA